MSYMALYRKWRPDAFEEIKGQEHIVTTIRNQIVHDRVGHAYLFCGTRGTHVPRGHAQSDFGSSSQYVLVL